MIGLIFLASLFTLAITQNRVVNQFTSALALAQAEDRGVECRRPERRHDCARAANLTTKNTTNGMNYFDSIYVNGHGKILVGDEIPQGQVPHYTRFWMSGKRYRA